MQSIKQMKEAKQMCQFLEIFFPPRDVTFSDGTKRQPMPPDEEFFATLVANFRKEVEVHKDMIAMASSYTDIVNNWTNGLSSAMLTVEDSRNRGGV